MLKMSYTTSLESCMSLTYFFPYQCANEDFGVIACLSLAL